MALNSDLKVLDESSHFQLNPNSHQLVVPDVAQLGGMQKKS